MGQVRVPVVVTVVTVTRQRFIGECFRAEPLSLVGESGVEAELGAQTRGGEPDHAQGEDEQGPSPGEEGERPGRDLDPGREVGEPGQEEETRDPGPGQVAEQPGQGPGIGIGEGGPEDLAQDRRDQEARAGQVRRRPRVGPGPLVKARGCGSMQDLQCRAS